MAGSIFSQLASLFFLFAAIFADIILIRFVLVIGNLFLLVNGSLGIPKWPSISNAPEVAIDMVVWSSLAIILHSYALACLLIDEKEIRRFSDDSCEGLFQYFHRRSGVCRRDFLPILNNARWVRIPKAGTVIPTESDFYLLVEGNACAEIVGIHRRHDDQSQQAMETSFQVKFASGNMFDMRFANIFGIPAGFLKSGFRAKTTTDDVLLCCWSVSSLKHMAKGPPYLVQTWKNITVFCLADIAHRPLLSAPTYRIHPDFTIDEEIDHRPGMKARISAFLHWILHSINPRPPKGLRHKPVPVISLDYAHQSFSEESKDLATI